jgi:hypothetical protein
MRCPDCNKFVSLEMQDPEVSDLSVEYLPSHDADNEPIHEFCITGTVRIVRCCAECGQEMKEAQLDIEQTVELGEEVDTKGAHDWEEFARTHDLDDARVDDSPSVDQIEEGGGRYAKSYFGAAIHFEVFVGDTVVATVEWSDKVAASSMDELV